MSTSGKRLVLAGIGGFLAGAAAVAIAVAVAMPPLMIVRHESTLPFDETVAALEQAIRDNGWASPGTMDLNKAMAKHGVRFEPRVRLIKLCKASYAARVLQDHRDLAALMPCTLAVYEADDGKVYISKMNTGLMGKLFGGTVAEVMGGSVSAEEAEILEAVTQ